VIATLILYFCVKNPLRARRSDWVQGVLPGCALCGVMTLSLLALGGPKDSRRTNRW